MAAEHCLETWFEFSNFSGLIQIQEISYVVCIASSQQCLSICGRILLQALQLICSIPQCTIKNLIHFEFEETNFRRPIKSYQNGSIRVNFLVFGSWILAILCALPMVILKGTVQIKDVMLNDQIIEQCYRLEGVRCPKLYLIKLNLSQIFPKNVLYFYHAFHVLTVFYVPLIVIVICYSLIGLSLKKQIEERQNLQVKLQSLSIFKQ